MPLAKRNVSFFDTEEGLSIIEILTKMTTDPLYNTESSYSANSEQYPDNLIPFVDKHKNYLIKNPSMDARQYVSNLKLVTRTRVNFAITH